MKFKPGDEVIVTYNDRHPDRTYRYLKGYSFVVPQRCVDYNDRGWKSAFYFEEDDYRYVVTEESLCLKSVYNSKLYKLLQEA